MFVSRDSGLSLSFAEVCYNGDPFGTLIRETRGGETRELNATDPRWGGRFLLYTGYRPD